MRILSVNIGTPNRLPGVRSGRMTGIYKIPANGPVEILRLGVKGDAVCDTKHHGGVDQAVYIYGEADYAWWSGKLARELAPGTFGENLTVSGLASGAIAMGDRFRIGSVVLEVTAPRIPCGTLARRMEDSGFVNRFRDAERPGLYCRVIREGVIQSGEPVSYERFDGDRITAAEYFRDFYSTAVDEQTLRRYLAAPIAIRDRIEKEKMLKDLTG